MTHFVNRLIDGGILGDVRVGLGDVGFRLVVIVVGDEILDRVFREVALELAVELRGEGLVGSDDQSRPLDSGDHLGHGERLAGTGNAEEGLFFDLLLQAAASFSMASGWSPVGRKSLRIAKYPWSHHLFPGSPSAGLRSVFPSGTVW